MPTLNLPAQATPFIGRSRELAEIATLLADPTCRFLTLLGPGGIGKTRLALQSAAAQFPHFAQGVYFVPLAPVGSPDLLPDAIASALQLTFYGNEDPRAQIIRYVREKQMLLVLDNFEHLLEAVDLLTDILQTAAGVKFLVTSRERLNLQEEWALALDGLRVPDDRADQRLESYSAVQLFVQRARQTQANFSLADNAQAVTAICQRVEGMPLGLELAATWLRAMSCREIAARMGSGLGFLSTPLRNVPERHRSLRAVFEQSWNLLSEAEQQVLAKLSVFRGGFDLEAAEQVAGALLPILAGLVDKSLIRLNPDGRYDLHELLRQYATDKLPPDETSATADRHLAYFLTLAGQARAHQFGAEQTRWFDRLDGELDNLRAALAWALQSENAESGLRLVASLKWFFGWRSYWTEGLTWMERMLAVSGDRFPLLRAEVLQCAGSLAGTLEDFPRAKAALEAALALSRQSNDRLNLGWTLSEMGFRLRPVETRDQSTARLDESLALFRQIDDPMGMAYGLIRRGWVAVIWEDYPFARAMLGEALISAQSAGDKISTALVFQLLGMIDVEQEDFASATAHFERMLTLVEEAHSPIYIAFAHFHLAGVTLAAGNMALAQNLYTDSLFKFREIMPNALVNDAALASLATIAQRNGDLERAAILLSAAEGGVMKHSRHYIIASGFSHTVAEVRAQIGEAAFAAAWAKGKAMTRERALTYALQHNPPLADPADTALATLTHQPVNQGLPEALSERELGVLRLVAEGMSNAEIAYKLSLSVGTVKVHTRNIYGKLGVSSRTQAVAEAQKLNLL